jgi:hypothetical protein
LRYTYLVAMLTVALAAGAQAAPTAEQFRAEMIKRFATVYPDRTYQAGDEELVISVNPGAKDEGTINLHRVFNYCQNVEATECEAASKELVEKTSKPAPDVTAASLRIIVRDAQYVAYLEEVEHKSKDGHRMAVRRKIGDDLFALLASDGPDTIATVGDDKLGELKLTEAAAWGMAVRQTRPIVPPLPDGDSLKQSAQAFTDFEYGASMLIDLDGWGKVAAAAGPDMFMTVASDRMVFVAVLPDGPNLDGFRKTVEEDCASQPRCISPNIYRFRDGRWVVAR